MMSKKTEFDACLGLLRQVLVVRGKDLSGLDEKYVWRQAEGAGEAPKTVVSLAPLLTGSELPGLQVAVDPVPASAVMPAAPFAPAMPSLDPFASAPSNPTTPGGVVSVPSGLVPPFRG